MTLLKMLKTGGFTMVILLICSVISIAVIVERIIYYRRRSKVSRADFMSEIKREMEKGAVKRALEIAKYTDTPFAGVVNAGLSFYGHTEKEISNNMERKIAIETVLLEKYTTIVGTIGSTAVYIGLFGTVLGIIRAFQDISLSGTGGMSVVINGVSEALICTAAGLVVAVPAVIAYNFFTKRVDNFVSDMELCASEIMDLITGKK